MSRLRNVYASTMRCIATAGAVLSVAFFSTEAFGDNAHVVIDTGPGFPGCGGKEFFEEQFIKTLGARAWTYPRYRAPKIQISIRKEVEAYALTLRLLIRTWQGEEFRFGPETRNPTECSRLLVRAAEVTAEVVPPPPELTKTLGVSWLWGVTPQPWIPSLYFEQGVTVPWLTRTKVSVTFALSPPSVWTAPDHRDVYIPYNGSITFKIDRRIWRNLEVGGALAVGMTYYAPRRLDMQQLDSTLPYTLVGPTVGYRLHLGHLPPVYIGGTAAVNVTPQQLQLSPRIPTPLFTSERAVFGLQVGVQFP